MTREHNTFHLRYVRSLAFFDALRASMVRLSCVDLLGLCPKKVVDFENLSLSKAIQRFISRWGNECLTTWSLRCTRHVNQMCRA